MISQETRDAIRPYVPKPLLMVNRRIVRLKREMPMIRLKYNPNRNTTFSQRSSLVEKILLADEGIDCRHTHAEMERIIGAILSSPSSVPACIVEAGCFKGGSTAKLSLAAKLVNRKLFVFDSFAGLPDHEENHETIAGKRVTNFVRGAYAGALEEVKENARRFGALENCEFVQGWFDDTMPHFHEPVAVAFIDVDLVTSTKTCLRTLYPKLIPGGTIFSHDGNLTRCVEVMADDKFWTSEVGYPKPPMPDLGHSKLVAITKPLNVRP